MSENVFSFGPGFTSEMEDMPDEGTTAVVLTDRPHHPIFDDNRRLLFCETIEQQLQAMQYFRKLLSVENEPPIDDVIDAGLVPRFVQFLENDSQRELQFEAAWALTNIASGEDSDIATTLVEHGVIPIFVRLIRTGDARIVEQSAWGIGNMVGENPEIRDLCLTEGVMPPLVEAAGRFSTNAAFLGSLAWTVSNLCRGEPKPSLALVSPAIPVLARLTRAASYQSFITDACWALFFISENSEEAVDMILATGIAAHLASLLTSSTSFELLLPVVRTVGNILSGNDGQTQRMIDAGAIPALSKILEIEQIVIWREVCWVLSNIAAGSSQQVQALFDATPPVFPKIVELLRTSTVDVEVQREALWVVVNGLGICSWDSILYLVDTLQVLRVLCGLLSNSDEDVVKGTLQCIHKLLERAADKGHVDRFIAVLEDMGAIDVVQNLQWHASSEVYQEALTILQTFFSVE